MDFDDSASVVTDTFDIDLYDITLDMKDLSNDEIKAITAVIEKGKVLRREERKRKKKIEESLDKEIVEIQSKNIDNGNEFCFICGDKFVLLLNPRQICDECMKGICGRCSYKIFRDERICCLCYLKASKDLKTGKWFAKASKQFGRFRRNPLDILANSMRKLQIKLVTPRTLSPLSKSNAAIVFNSKNGNIWNPSKPDKEQTSIPVRKEIAKKSNQIPIENTTDVYDLGSIDELDFDPKVEPKEKSSIHSPSIDENSKDISGTISSMYSGMSDSGKSDVSVSNDVQFSVYYDDIKNSLNIFMDQSSKLTGNKSNKRHKQKHMKSKSSKRSKTKSNISSNVPSEQSLPYQKSNENAQSQTLSVSVWHKKSMSVDCFHGEVHILLCDVELLADDSVPYQIMERIEYPNKASCLVYNGELIIKLKYQRSTRNNGKGSLYVLIEEAIQIESEGKQILSAHVEGYLLPERKHKNKKNILIEKNDKNIKFYTLLHFIDVTLPELKHNSLELSINHHRKMKFDEFIGALRLNLGLGMFE